MLSLGQKIPHTANHISSELEFWKITQEEEWVKSLGIRRRISPEMSRGATLIRNICVWHKLGLFHDFARGPTL